MIKELKKEAQNLSVLFVEDDLSFLNILKELLEKFFPTVETAMDGEEGLAKYKEAGSFDIVITDITMPKMDGLTMSENIKSINPSQHILAVSAHSDADKLIKAIDIGVDSFLLKPVDSVVFLDRLLKISKAVNRKALEDREKELENLLITQSKMASMGEMIGNIAHQWRQPLNIIQSSITKISIYKEMGAVTDEFLEETVQNVKRQVAYLSSTIDDFRSFYKDDPGGSFILEDAVKKSLSLVEAVYKNHFIEVDIECDGCKNVKIKGSINRFIQALLNILNNSKDAIVGNEAQIRVVKIGCKRTLGGAALSVVDSGGGISAKNIPRVFDPYFSTKNKSQGTGIGLYMTRQIIENSFGGTIEAKNVEFERGDKKLKGASFTIELHDEELG